MTEKQLNELFQKHDGEYLKFREIPAEERLHSNVVLCGLLKLAALMKDPNLFDINAEHEKISFYDFEYLREDITEADVVYLLRCGIYRLAGEFVRCASL